MKGLIEYIKKSYGDIDDIVGNYDKSSVILDCIFDISLVKIEYSYTNSKNGKRKSGYKYFVCETYKYGSELTKEAYYRGILLNWMSTFNESRKYQLLKPSMVAYDIIQTYRYTGGSTRERMSSVVLKKSLGSHYDIREVDKLNSLFDIIDKKPSNNKMDYVINCSLRINVCTSLLTYKTIRGNERKKEIIIFSLEQEECNCASMIYSLESKVKRYTKLYNDRYPMKAKTVLGIEKMAEVYNGNLI